MKPSTHDLIAYLEQNELKYAQRSDDPDGHPNSPAYGHLKLPHLN